MALTNGRNNKLLVRYSHCLTQHAKKFVSDSLRLVKFATGLVIFVLNLPNEQVLFFGEIQIKEGF